MTQARFQQGGLSIDLSQLEQFNQLLGNALLGAAGRRKLLWRLGKAVKEQTQQHIRKGGPGFPPKSPLFQYLAGGSTLRVKDNLLRSITPLVDSNTLLRVGSGLPYARRQQEGGKGPAGHKKFMVLFILPEYEPALRGGSNMGRSITAMAGDQVFDEASGVSRTKEGKFRSKHYGRSDKHGWRIKRFPGTTIPMGKLVPEGTPGAIKVLLPQFNIRPRPFLRQPDAAETAQLEADMREFVRIEVMLRLKQQPGAVHA